MPFWMIRSLMVQTLTPLIENTKTNHPPQLPNPKIYPLWSPFYVLKKNCFVNKRLSETKNWCIKTHNSLQKIEELGRFWGVFDSACSIGKKKVLKQNTPVQKQQHSLKQKHKQQGKNPILLRKLHRRSIWSDAKFEYIAMRDDLVLTCLPEKMSQEEHVDVEIKSFGPWELIDSKTHSRL